jgi:hypothetical protein
MQSESLGKLADALAKAQAAIKPPKKGRTAKLGTYSYHYADLADVIECYREPLSKVGLALVQLMRPEDGHFVLTTQLLHSSGEWIGSEYPIAAYSKPQEQGSAITYARRYAVTALLGIAAEDDDDGQAAQEAELVKRKEPRATKPTGDTLTSEEVQAVYAAAKLAGYTTPGALAPVLTNIVGIGRAGDIPRAELKNVLDALGQMASHPAEASA